jgi:hypothetical protein
MSPPIHHAVNSIEANVISDILSRNIDTKISEKSVLKNMFKDTVDSLIYSDIDIETSDGSINDEAVEYINNTLYERLTQYNEVFIIQNTKIKSLTSERDKAIKKAKYYRSELTRRTKKK